MMPSPKSGNCQSIDGIVFSMGPDKLDEHFACGSRMSRFLYGDQAVSASTGMTAEATWKRASIASLLEPNC
jgi:hypothetical protein